MTEEPFAGKAILVVEDEYFLATDLRRGLIRLGAVVIGPAPSVTRALDLINAGSRIDAAILDVSLGGEPVFPAADQLRERGVPFLFVTGYDHSMIPTDFANVLRCEKPMASHKLIRALSTIMAQV